MADTKISIPTDELGGLLGAQILASLSEATKANLVEAALKHLLTKPETGRYGEKGDSPLEYAFKEAVRAQAYDLAKKLLEDPEISARVTAGVSDLLENVPDIKDDWQLQEKVFAAILERAKEIKEENRGY